MCPQSSPGFRESAKGQKGTNANERLRIATLGGYFSFQVAQIHLSRDIHKLPIFLFSHTRIQFLLWLYELRTKRIQRYSNITFWRRRGNIPDISLQVTELLKVPFHTYPKPFLELIFFYIEKFTTFPVSSCGRWFLQMRIGHLFNYFHSI